LRTIKKTGERKASPSHRMTRHGSALDAEYSCQTGLDRAVILAGRLTEFTPSIPAMLGGGIFVDDV
jgi:hypothetical protein